MISNSLYPKIAATIVAAVVSANVVHTQTFYFSAEQWENEVGLSATENFDSLAPTSGGNLGVQRFTMSGAGYSFDVVNAGGNINEPDPGNLWGLHSTDFQQHQWEGWGISTQHRFETLVFEEITFGGPVTAIAGNFFLTDPIGSFRAGALTITFHLLDGSSASETISPADHEGSFLGVIASQPITWFEAIPGENGFVASSEVIVGTAIPEPSIAALLAALAALGIVVVRRTRDRRSI